MFQEFGITSPIYIPIYYYFTILPLLKLVYLKEVVVSMISKVCVYLYTCACSFGFQGFIRIGLQFRPCSIPILWVVTVIYMHLFY